MKGFIYLALIAIVASAYTLTKKYSDVWYTKTAKIGFFSSTPIEDIKAANGQVVLAFNQKTGKVSAKATIKSFVFPKKLMQEHFNENYMESDKFPYATFSGNIMNIENIDFAKDSSDNFINPKNYDVLVEGELTMHGVTNKIKTSGTINCVGNTAKIKTVFSVMLEDYKIDKPSVVALKIADKIEITIEGACKQ